MLSLTFNPSGTHLLSGSADGTARLYRWENNNAPCVAILIGHEGDIASVAFHPRMATIATGSADKVVRLWDLDGNCVEVLQAHSDEVFQVEWNRSGSRLLSGGKDNKIWLYISNQDGLAQRAAEDNAGDDSSEDSDDDDSDDSEESDDDDGDAEDDEDDEDESGEEEDSEGDSMSSSGSYRF